MKADRIRSIAMNMQVGQVLKIDRDDFEMAFPVHPIIGMYREPRQAFLSSMPGTAWGEWTCEIDPFSRYSYVIKRPGGGQKRVYCDPDREHLYQRQEDGTLEYIGGDNHGR